MYTYIYIYVCNVYIYREKYIYIYSLLIPQVVHFQLVQSKIIATPRYFFGSCSKENPAARRLRNSSRRRKKSRSPTWLQDLQGRLALSTSRRRNNISCSTTWTSLEIWDLDSKKRMELSKKTFFFFFFFRTCFLDRQVGP